MRKVASLIFVMGTIVLFSNGCAPASKSWVMEYTNSRVSALTARLSAVRDTVQILNDSLAILSQKVQDLSDSVSNLATLRTSVNDLKIRIDTLEIAVDSVKHFQRQIVPAYLKTLRDIIDEYIQSTQDTL